MKPRVDKLMMEQKREGYEDDFRNIAWFGPACASEPAEYVAVIDGADKYEYLEIECCAGDAKIYINGELVGSNLAHGQERTQHQYRPYRFDIKLLDGENVLKIVSTTYEGENAAFSGYVRLSRMKPKKWRIRLHYGLARVFVKGKNAKVKANIIK